MTREYGISNRYSTALDQRRNRWGVWDTKRGRWVRRFGGKKANLHAQMLTGTLNRRSRRWGWFGSLIDGDR
jgi:hypothetical protein